MTEVRGMTGEEGSREGDGNKRKFGTTVYLRREFKAGGKGKLSV